METRSDVLGDRSNEGFSDQFQISNLWISRISNILENRNNSLSTLDAMRAWRHIRPISSNMIRMSKSSPSPPLG
jgi:hypothetical protein